MVQTVGVDRGDEPRCLRMVADEGEGRSHPAPLPCRTMDALGDWSNAAARAPRASFLAEVRAAGALHGSAPVCTHRTPLLLPATTVRAFRRILPPMHRLLRRVRERMLADVDRGPESLAAALGVSPDAMAWARIDPGFPDVAPLARLDAFVEEGIPRFLELNAESPAGMGYASALGPLLAADPAARGWEGLDFVDPLPLVVSTFRALAREWLVRTEASRRGVGFGRHFRVAIVDCAGVATAPEFDILAAGFRAQGHPADVVTPDELSFDGDRLRARGAPVDVLYRRFLVADLRRDPTPFAPVLAAIRTQRVCMVNSLRTALLHSKGVFAHLHSNGFAVTPAERRFIDRHVPLTLLCDDDARERVRREPERWVLKPVDGHGGRGVVLGWEVGRAAWERAVDEAEGCVLQRRVRGSDGLFFDARDEAIHRRAIDLGPFLARGRFAGFLCRVVEGSLANVSAGGASQVPVFSYTRRP